MQIYKEINPQQHTAYLFLAALLFLVLKKIATTEDVNRINNLMILVQWFKKFNSSQILLVYTNFIREKKVMSLIKINFTQLLCIVLYNRKEMTCYLLWFALW